MIKKVIVFHPMQQHSFQTARALIKSNILYEYWTSIYYNPNKLLYKILEKVLDENNLIRMKNRNCDELTPYVRTSSTVLGLILLLSLRLDKNNIIKFKLQNILSKKMGKIVAKNAIKNDADVVIVYDTWAHGVIKELKKRKSNISVVLDCSSLYPEKIKDIIEKDIEINKESKDSYKLVMRAYKEKYLKLFRYEIENSDYFFSPSSVVDNSLIDYGISKVNIFRCVYGSNFKPIKYDKKMNTKTTFVYIGRLSYAKGVHYLIEAFNKLNRNDCKLILIGQDVDELSKKISTTCIEYIGFIVHDKIPEYLMKSDIAISASLYDGFSLSLIESAAYNLPIICTENTGFKDMVTNCENGFIAKCHDYDNLLKVIEYVLDNKNLIEAMSKKISKVIDKLTWDNYYKQVNNSILEIDNMKNRLS